MLSRKPIPEPSDDDFAQLDQAIDQLVSAHSETVPQSNKPQLSQKHHSSHGRIFDIAPPKSAPKLKANHLEEPSSSAAAEDLLLDDDELASETATTFSSDESVVEATSEESEQAIKSVHDEPEPVLEEPEDNLDSYTPLTNAEDFLPAAKAAKVSGYQPEQNESELPVFDINKAHPPLLPATTRRRVGWWLAVLLLCLGLVVVVGFILLAQAS